MTLVQENTLAFKSPRRRKKRQRHRLLSAFATLAKNDSRLTLLGEDLLFTALLQNSDCNSPTTAPCQFLYNGIAITLVGVPDRLWSKTAPMAQLTRAKVRMEALGRRCYLLPHSAISNNSNDDKAVRAVLDTLVEQVKPIETRRSNLSALPFLLSSGQFTRSPECIPG